MIARRLNKDGIARYESFVHGLSSRDRLVTPVGLLTDQATSESLDVDIEIDDRKFGSRYELGEYLVERLKGISDQSLIGDAGFWDGLSLFWFDQLCPLKPDGSRKPSKIYNYCLTSHYWHRTRHAVFATYQLVSRYGPDARFLLSKELHTRGEIIEQMMARQYYLGCRGVMRAASRLYYDEERKTFKRGAAGRTSGGCVYRYVAWLQQLEMTYDVYSMSAEELLELMPPEFDRFKPKIAA